MALKQLVIPLCDIKQNPSEEVLSLCKSSTVVSETCSDFGVVSRKRQIQEEDDDSVHVEKIILKDKESEEEEGHISVKKRTLRNLKNEEEEDRIVKKRTLKNSKKINYAEIESDDNTSDEEEDHIHLRKRVPRNKKYVVDVTDSESDKSSDEEGDHIHLRKRLSRNKKYAEEEDHVHLRKRASRNKKYVVKVADSESDKSSDVIILDSESDNSTKEPEDDFHIKKRVSRVKKPVVKFTDTEVVNACDEEKKIHSHSKKKEFRNGKSFKEHKQDIKKENDSPQKEEEETHEDNNKKLNKEEPDCAAACDYEKMLAEKLKEQLAFLRSLGIREKEEKNSNVVRERVVRLKGSDEEEEDDIRVKRSILGAKDSDIEEAEDDMPSRKRKLRTLKDVKYTECESDGNASDEDYAVSSENSVYASASSDEDEDFDGDDKKKESSSGKSHKKHKHSSKKRKDSSQKSAPLSEYEKMIAEKNKDRLALLQSLGVTQAKADLCDTVTELVPKPVKREPKKKRPEVAVRASHRLAEQTSSIDFNEDALFNQNMEKAKQETPNETALPLEMSFKTALKDPETYENYCQDFNIQNPTADFKDVQYNKNLLDALTLNECSFVKVIPSPTELAWYPSSEDLILAAGNRCGHLAIFKLGSKSNPSTFEPHAGFITNLLFNPLNRIHMVSSSNDGSVQCADLVKHTFTRIYNAPPNSKCSYFDFLSLTTCLVAQNDGEVALIDYRTNKITGQMKHQCHTQKINTVHVHPVQKYNFLTASTDSFIHLWDLRMLLKKKPVTYNGHSSAVQSAYFSPGTGNSILSATLYDISIIDSQDLTQSVEMRSKITGKGTSSLRNAKWLPGSQSMYILNRNGKWRSVEVYAKGLRRCLKVQHENLLVKGFSTFHPCRPLLAGVDTNFSFFFFYPLKS